MRAGEDTLRRSIAAATDGRTRTRLRVDLAELLRVRDAAAARFELDQALREGGTSGALTLAVLSFARSLPPADRVAWLAGLGKGNGKGNEEKGEGSDARTPSPVLVSALADAQLGADLPRDAALTWLGLARDERVALHHRRAAARKAARLGARLPPADARAAEMVAAELSVGKGRRGPRSSARELADTTAPEAKSAPPRKAAVAPAVPSPRPACARRTAAALGAGDRRRAGRAGESGAPPR